MLRRFLRARVVNLKSLIVFLAFTVAFITLINGLYASYQVQKRQLIEHTLGTNHAYAQKLAQATDNFIAGTYEQLAYSATMIADHFTDVEFLMAEAERLYKQTNSFNSVTVVDAQGVVLAAAPNTLDIVGSQLTEGGGPEALSQREPMVSRPYLSLANNFLVLISYPIFNRSEEYLGYVGGTIYLKKPSIFNDLLGRHFHRDGSYIYVVDSNKQIIYHPESERVGEYILNNAVINSVVERHSGFIEVINSKGIDMLAGFSPIQRAHWGVVAQRPVDATLAPLDSLIKAVAFRTLPLALLTFILIWLLASYISRPLQQLAATAVEMDDPNAYQKLGQIKSWYLEVRELKLGILKGLGVVNTKISQLKEDAATDALTGAVNRRSVQVLLETMEQERIPFSVLAIDIDHFKRVNDTYGHPAGDKALVALVRVISQISRAQDVIARVGGEEFLLILPNTPIDLAEVIAERVRSRIAALQIELVGSIQVSIGIASSGRKYAAEQVLQQADIALYQAKQQGRNRCEVYVPSK